MQSIWRQEGTGLVFIRQNSPQIAAVAMVEGIPGTEEHVLEVQCHAKSGRRRAERQPCVNYEPSDHLNTALIISCTPMEISNAHLNNSLARNGIQLQTPAESHQWDEQQRDGGYSQNLALTFWS